MSKHRIIAGFVASIIATLPLITPVSAIKYHTITVTYPYYGFVEDPADPWESAYDALDETGTVEYSDEFFLVPSTGDHPELRAVSYALALAGYENQKDGYPYDPSNPNPKLIGLLDQLGFSDYQTWDEASDANGDSMGTTIGHKTLSTGQELIVIAPRNYNYLTEWLSNFNVGTSGDHAGFSNSAAKITERFNQYLSSHDFSNYKVWVVGYSRGGAVIDLFAKNLNENIANYDLLSDNLYAYTFGAPRASAVETKFANIHDVKDGNDLMLGYVFPEQWGFYNTGINEEIHPADLTITTSVIDISNLADSSRAGSLLASNDGLTREVGTMNGKEFMNAWMQFVTDNGLTRDYFNSTVKVPLSAIMQAYQSRTLDKQSEFIDFLKNTDNGLLAMLARRALLDLTSCTTCSDIKEALDAYPLYNDIVAVLKGTATDTEIDEIANYLEDYIGEYGDYESTFASAPSVTEAEFGVIKDNLPKLVKALAPIIVADAKYTIDTYGENSSLYYTYSLIDNAEKLVYGHIPESIMPILKNLIIVDEETTDIVRVPDTGIATSKSRNWVYTNSPLFPTNQIKLK